MVSGDVVKLVQREDWQRVRKSLLGKWKTDPEGNIRALRKWLGPVSKATMGELRIMKNYIDALSRGGIKVPKISPLKESVEREIARRKIKEADGAILSIRFFKNGGES